MSLFPTPQRPEAAMMRDQTNLVHLALTKALLYPTGSAVVVICSLGKLMIGGDKRHIIGAGYYTNCQVGFIMLTRTTTGPEMTQMSSHTLEAPKNATCYTYQISPNFETSVYFFPPIMVKVSGIRPLFSS